MRADDIEVGGFYTTDGMNLYQLKEVRILVLQNIKNPKDVRRIECVADFPDSCLKIQTSPDNPKSQNKDGKLKLPKAIPSGPPPERTNTDHPYPGVTLHRKCQRKPWHAQVHRSKHKFDAFFATPEEARDAIEGFLKSNNLPPIQLRKNLKRKNEIAENL